VITMRKHLGLLGIAIVLVLTGCKGEIAEKKNDDKINEFVEQAFTLNEVNHAFMEDLSKEKVKEFVFQMKDENYKLIAMNETYSEIAEGITDDGNGKKVCCYKLPVTFSFCGDESLINDFLNSLKNRDTKIVMNRFEVTEEDDRYSVECLASFIGSSAKVGVGGASNSFAVAKNAKEVKEEEKIVLRDFDVNLTVRPSNSDAAAVTVSTEAGNSLYKDENELTDVIVNFYQEGSSYYCKYSVGDQSKTDKISVGSEVLFDILSCKKVLDTDDIAVNLTIQSTLSKKVSVMVHNDSDERIKIMKSGNVEVSRK